MTDITAAVTKPLKVNKKTRMAINFQGEVASISNVQLEIIRSVLHDQGFKNGEAVISIVGKQGDNFSASVKRISITNGNETFKMFAKIAPQHEMFRQMAKTATVFKNEIIMYSEVFPKFEELQKSAGISDNERCRFPFCYGYSVEPLHEIVLLEDLDVLNFGILDRYKASSDEYVRLTLKNFARFHALSYALKYQEPETYAAIARSLVDYWLLVSKIPLSEQVFIQLEASTIEIVGEDKFKNGLKGLVAKAAVISSKFTKAESGGQHCVIQHGDSWINNIMFKFIDETPVETIFVDYQLSKESNPVCDLFYMIFNCTDYDMRKKHFYDWIDYYHTELDNSLHNFSLKANFVYPKEQLDVDLKRYGKVMFGLLVITSSVLIRKPEDANKIIDHEGGNVGGVDLFKMGNLDKDSVMLFKTRIEGIVDSFVEFGIL